MATFIGSTQGGILGSFVATLGVVLPSFLIILLIASALKNLMKYAPVNAFLSGVRPCVVAMILATALSMALSTLFGLTDLQAGFAPDLRSIAVFSMLGATHLICKKIRKTAPSPILMILFSAGLGILFWCIFWHGDKPYKVFKSVLNQFDPCRAYLLIFMDEDPLQESEMQTI